MIAKRRLRAVFGNVKARVATIVSIGLVAAGLSVIAPVPSASAVVLNDNTSVFQITFTGLTALPTRQVIMSPNGVQVAWTLNGTQPTETDFINIASFPAAYYIANVPVSGSNSSGAATVPTTIVATDTVMMTIRDNPTDAIAGSIAGYLGDQSAGTARGQKTATNFADHSGTSGNPYAKELISFGQFSDFKYLQDAFARVPATFVMSAKLPATVTDLSNSFGNTGGVSTWNRADITAWDVSHVTTFAGMFARNSGFNQDLSAWDTAAAIDMSNMFNSASAFNGSVGTWNTSSVTNMSSMFMSTTAFNQSLNSWNTSSVTNMSQMFYQATAFNGAIDQWNTSNVTNMTTMFRAALKFNQPIGSWNTSKVTNMSWVFFSAVMFNQSLNGWDTSKATTMSYMFASASAFNGDISAWNTSSVIYMDYMFGPAVKFNQDISAWNTSNVTTMASMFAGATAFNQNLSTWDTSKVTTMVSMFSFAQAFNGDISTWNTSKVTTMASMFSDAKAFNGDISAWNTSSVNTMLSMFQGAIQFNRSLASWNTSRVSTMASMFSGATVFNGDISTWDTSFVLDMSSMFKDAKAFNQPIGSWNTRFVSTMYSMFTGATAFNQPVGSWNTSNVTTMFAMFNLATAFNQPLDGWNVSQVTSFQNMFNLAISFNQPLNTWRPLKSTNLAGIFYRADAYNQAIHGFVISTSNQTGTGASSKIDLNAGMSQANVNATIAAWANQTPNGSTYVNLANNLNWYSDCQSYAAYSRLHSWVIKSGGLTPAVPTGCSTSTITWATPVTATAPSISNYVMSFTPSVMPAGVADYRFSSRTRECQVDPITGRVSYISTAINCVVRAWDNDPSASMSYVDVTITLPTWLSAPTAPSIPNVVYTSSGAKFTWAVPSSAGSLPITNYMVRLPIEKIVLCYVPATSLSCTVDGLVPGTSYNPYYYAISDAGMSPMSYINFNYDLPPGAPTITSITPGTGLGLTLEFTPGTSRGTAITGYEFSTDNGTTWAAATSTSSPTTLLIPNQSKASPNAFVGGTTYAVLLRAKNTYTKGEASVAANGTPLDRQIGAPTITGYTAGSSILNVSFTAPTLTGSAISNYEYSTDGGSTWRVRSPASATTTMGITLTSTNGTTLVNNTNYSVMVRAVTGAGSGVASNASTMASNSPPTAPTAVTVSLSGTTATLSWTASTVGLGITYTATSTPGGLTCSVAAPTTTCQIPGLSYGTSYTFVVKAVNTAGSTSSSMTAAYMPEVMPGAPTINSITGGNQQLSVDFTAGTNNGSAITKYQYSTDGGTNWRDAVGMTSPLVLTTVSPVANTALVNNTSYNVKIRAFNAVAGTPSSTVAGKPNVALAAPTAVVASLNGASATVSWTAPTGYVESYQVTANAGGFSCAPAGSATSCVVSSLTLGQTFTFTVTATNSSGTSPVSAASNSVSPENAPGAPAISAITSSSQQFSIAFTSGLNLGSAITSMEYSTDGGSTWFTAPSTTSPIVVTKDSSNVDLVDGQTYSVKLRARNSVAGVASAAISATPSDMPMTPTGVTASLSGRVATVSWSASTGATGYTVTSSPAGFGCTTSDPTTTCVTPNLTYGVAFTFTVTASNVAGSSAASSATAPLTAENAPGAPTISGVTSSDQQISIAFTAGTNTGSAITSYEYSTDAGITWLAAGALTSPITVSKDSSNVDLVNGQTYSVQIRAVNTIVGADSNLVSTTPDVALSAPTISSLTPSGQQLAVNFVAGVNLTGSAVTKYQYSTDGGTTWRDASGTTSPLVITTISGAANTTLVNATSYSVKIRGFNSRQGAASAAVSGTPEATPGAPIITAITPGDRNVSVAFTAATNTGSAITKYQYSTDGGSTWRNANRAATPITVSTISGAANTALINGTSYDVQIRAVNTVNGAASSTVVGTPDVAPDAPSAVRIIGGDQQLSVDFRAGANSGSAITKYQYTTDGGTTWKDLTLSSTPTILTDTRVVITSESNDVALINGRSYTVHLRAINTLPSSRSQGLSSSPDHPLAAPTVTSVTQGDARLTVAFTAPMVGNGTAIVQYEYSTDGGTTWRATTGLTSPFALTTVSGGAATPLVNGTSYNLQLRAKNALTGAASTTIPAVPDVAPGAPTLGAITSSDRQLTAAFTAGTNTGTAITKYQYSTDGGSTWRDRSTGTTASPIIITTTSDANTPLVNGTSYTVLIRAKNFAAGAASNSVSAAPDVVPGAVTNLVATGGDAEVGLSWTAPASSSITNYRVEYSTNGTTFTTFARSASITTTVTVTGLTNGTSYTFRVTTLNGDAYSPTVTSNEATPRADQAALSWGFATTSLPYLGTLTLSTSGGSGNGQVVYTASQASTCAISGNILIAGNAGSECIITATKLTDGAYNPTSTSTRVITIDKIAQTSSVALTNANTMAFGDSLTLNAIGGTGTGAYHYTVVSAGTTGCSVDTNNGILTVSASGTCQVGAQRLTSTNYLDGSVATQNISVTTASQTISFTSASPTSPVAGGNYTPTASSNRGLPVSFTVSSGPCAILAGIVTFNSSGSCVIRGRQLGDSQFGAAAEIFQTIAVGQRNQTLTFTAATTSRTQVAFGSASFAVDADSTESTAVISFARGVTTTNNACTVSAAGLVTVLAVGTCMVEASSPATSSYAAASTISHAIDVLPAPARAPFLTSVSTGNRSITANFTPPGQNGGSAVSGYELVAIPQSGQSLAVYESGCSTTLTNGVATCTVRGLVNGVNYKVQVAAVTAAGLGAYSDLSASLLVATNPSAVQSLSVSQLNAQLLISWADPDSLGGGTFVSYRIFVKRSSAASYDQANFFEVTDNTVHDFTASTQTPTGAALVNGVAYDIKVVTVTTANSSELSGNTAVVNQIPRTIPDAPRVAGAIVMGSSVVLTWRAPLSDGGAAISGYVATLNGSPCVIAVPTDLFCTAPAPSASGTYPYQVTAANVAGNGTPAIGSVSVTLAGPRPTPSPSPSPNPGPVVDPSPEVGGSSTSPVTPKPSETAQPEPQPEPSSSGLAEPSDDASTGGVFLWWLIAALVVLIALITWAIAVVARRRRR